MDSTKIIRDASTFSLVKDGFTLETNVFSQDTMLNLIDAVDALRKQYPNESLAGMRHLLTRSDAIRAIAYSRVANALAVKSLGAAAKPVKAILFDKTPESNWFVTWHQDLTIAVKARIDVPGFGPWSVKQDIPHVQPPASVLEKMVALRIHLDDCSVENGAIRFIPGSHNAGILETNEIAERSKESAVCCAAARGEVIVMRPLVLHSSSASQEPAHRRVLHIEYAADPLPGGLEWAEGSGLDGVELVLALEEEFGVDIKNHHAENILTVGEMFAYLKSRLRETPADECMTQRIFYQLRRALIANYNLDRRAITPESKLIDLLTEDELASGWPYLKLFIDLKTPSFKVANELLGIHLWDRDVTMRQLVGALISLNSEKLFAEVDSEDKIWRRLVDVIVTQTNVNRAEVTMQASFTRDLGIC